ncbi:MAG: hypothetical protein L6V79_07305 [Clostridium sp.]|nr:MAG: hypothetical protein L6V79_07305 [Clostridium sp.]
MTAAERRQAILEVLCMRRHETRENLANEFGVSKRTIEYDVLNLMLTYPVYTVQGNGGGIYVTDNFRLDRPRMNEKANGVVTESSSYPFPERTKKQCKTLSTFMEVEKNELCS